ncbi:MAG TPA: RsmD family RNA methyltransferase [Planctomycetota bacterium]|jgi:23S rRNA (cytosine1962-C5)-methyltransferase|nr:RsmD family RNA methyltransferase [Planctomycetota bacterium]
MAASAFPPHPFPDHALLDCGDGEKLERFGAVVVRRPDPQALWPRALEDSDWRKADLTFVRDEASGGRGGQWISGKGARGPEWPVRYGDATFLARPTPFKHVGIFPEQASNWDLVARARAGFGVERPRLLNLFGYTGVASVLALRAEYDVTHVDASKTSLAWARDNLGASGLAADAMKIVLDDALAFTQREARRAARYQVVLLDPPHHGRGPRGEKWQFEDSIGALVQAVKSVLADRALVVLSSYAIGCSPLTLENLLADLGAGALEAGELVLAEQGPRARLLPAGFCARWSRGLDLPRAAR